MDERLLHRDLGQVAEEKENMSAARRRDRLVAAIAKPPFARRQCAENPPAV